MINSTRYRCQVLPVGSLHRWMSRRCRRLSGGFRRGRRPVCGVPPQDWWPSVCTAVLVLPRSWLRRCGLSVSSEQSRSRLICWMRVMAVWSPERFPRAASSRLQSRRSSQTALGAGEALVAGCGTGPAPGGRFLQERAPGCRVQPPVSVKTGPTVERVEACSLPPPVTECLVALIDISRERHIQAAYWFSCGLAARSWGTTAVSSLLASCNIWSMTALPKTELICVPCGFCWTA